MTVQKMVGEVHSLASESEKYFFRAQRLAYLQKGEWHLAAAKQAGQKPIETSFPPYVSIVCTPELLYAVTSILVNYNITKRAIRTCCTYT